MRPRYAAIAVVASLFASALAAPATAVPAASTGDCIPAKGTAPLVGTTPCLDVRPGAFIAMPASGSTCTLGFLFRDQRGRSYMTTAGHCVLAAEAERTWGPRGGPTAVDIGGKKVGTFVYAAMRGIRDFGLLLVDRNVRPRAQVCHFGGPTGLNNDRRNDPALLEFYGQADFPGGVLPARSGVTINTRDDELIWAQAPIGLGDSGGPWMTSDGRAIGYLTHVLGYRSGTEIGLALLRRLGPQVANAERALGIRLTLVTARRIP